MKKLRKQKVLACLLAGTMVLSMAACAKEETPASASTEETSVSTEVSAETPEVAAEEEFKYDDTASITFDDGNYAFLGSDTTVNPAAKETLFAPVDRNGQKAIAVTSAEGVKTFLAVQMDALLGDSVGEVASVEFVVETELGDKFTATSGNIYYIHEGAQNATAWSIYLENKNPKTVTAPISEAAAGDYLVFSLEDSGSGTLEGATVYLYSISFKDAQGNVLIADSSAEYVAVSTGADRSNLFAIKDEVVVAGLAGKGGGWSQIGYQELTEEEWAKLTTPGSVVEIEYSASTGNIWMGLSGNAWTRLGVGDFDGSGQGYTYYNNSKTIAQFTYEQIAEILGEDTSAWDKSIFIESDGDFEVFSVKIGQKAPNYVCLNPIDVAISGKGDGWGQIGYLELNEEQLAALRTPGSIVEVEYTSESGDLWIGLSGNAWTRVGVGNADGSGTVDAITDGSKCYVTYDMIAELCGEDPSAWDVSLFVESDTSFEVFSVKIGQAGEFVPNFKQIDAGISGKGDGWSQLNYDVFLSDEALAALKTPGSVVNISYTSETGECWIVMTSGANGWVRVGVGNFDGSGQGFAVYDGSNCQITHEMIAQWYGEDPETWGNQIVCEASSAFEIFSVNIGQTK